MYKLLIIFLFSYMLIGCRTVAETSQNMHALQSYSNDRLTDENIFHKFLEYSFYEFNDVNSNNFAAGVISRRPSSIQQ